jgi:hypothetical protein
MYQDRVRNVLSPRTAVLSAEIETAMWNLFVAIGEFWELKENAAGYRLRLRAFMANRISLHPEYERYYELAARVIAKLIADRKAELIAQGVGEAEAQTQARKDGYEELITKTTGSSELGQVREAVSREFIVWRLALGGFLALGALNYRGYFGGANLPNEPVPYRTREPRP